MKDSKSNKSKDGKSKDGKSKDGKSKDIDSILKNWPFDPEEPSVRLIKAKDGRKVLQMRLDMGLMQMELEHRPDGTRPHNAESYYDYLVELAFKDGDDFKLNEEQFEEIDREFVQYYHRRISWLTLRDFRKATRDADHTLALMKFCKKHSPDEQWTLSHEQYKPFVLFHRTQAEALADLEDSGPEAAIASIDKGLKTMRDVFSEYDAEEIFEEDDTVVKLIELRDSLKEHYDIEATLEEQLVNAIETEDYEEAASIRDRISKRQSKKRGKKSDSNQDEIE